MTAIGFAAVAMLITLPYFPDFIRYVIQTGNLRNIWLGFVFQFVLLGAAGLFVFVEFFGTARQMQLLRIPLVLMLLLSAMTCYGCYITVTSPFFSLTTVLQNPQLLLQWVMCPIIWVYTLQCFLRRGELRDAIRAERVATEDHFGGEPSR